MFIGTVIGNVVCSRKDERLRGSKLLVVEMLTPDGRKTGNRQIALDGIGVAGQGDFVYMTKGKEAGLPFPDQAVPTELSVVGIIDRINLK